MTYKTHWAYMICFFVLGVYLLTLPKGIGLGDSGTLAAAAANWGIPHPPGFPSYVLLAHWFTYLPWGTVAQRLALISILASVGTVGFIMAMAGIVPALILAFSYGFWGQAVNVETYALTNFVIVFVSYLAWQEKPKWWLIGLVLGFGLGLSPIVVAVIPGIILNQFSKSQFSKLLQFVVPAILVALGVYSYLPIRASQHPFLNWSDPSTVDRFIKHVMGGGLSVVSSTAVNGFTGSAYWMLDAWRRFGQLLIMEFAGIPVLFMIIGAYFLWQKDRSRFMYWTLLVFINLTLAGLYVSGNRDSWFITSFIAGSIFIGEGIRRVLPLAFPATRFNSIVKEALFFHNRNNHSEVKTRRGRPSFASPVLIYVFVVIVALLPLFVWFPTMWQRARADMTGQYINDLYKDLPSKAILLGGGETFNSLTLYAHEALKLRPDVTPVDFTIFYGQRWYRENISLSFPRTRESREEKTGSPIRSGMTDTIDMPKFSDEREFSRILEQFADANKDRPIFVTGYLLTQPVYGGTMTAAYVPKKYQLEQHGIVYRLISNLQFPISNEIPIFNVSKIPKYLESNYQKAVGLIQLEYGLALEKQGDYFLRLGRTDEAFSLYRKAAEAAPLYFDQNRLGQKIQMLTPASPSAVPSEIQSAH